MSCFLYDSNCFRYLVCYRGTGDMGIPFKVGLDNDTEDFSLGHTCNVF